MKIIGVLSWFDESPHWLATAVAGMGRICDTIVAVDGAYRLYPGARPCSHPQQAEAIMVAAEAAGAGCIIHRPNTIWHGNELEKRQHTLALAGALCQPDQDWILIFDADFHILRLEPDTVRAELAATTCDVATFTLLDGKEMMADAWLADYARQRDVDTEWTMRTRDIYRWHPTLTIGPAHWCYSDYRYGSRRWLKGPYKNVAPALDLNANLAVYHRTQDRAMVRRKAADGYYRNRDLHQIERIDGADPEVNGPLGLIAQAAN